MGKSDKHIGKVISEANRNPIPILYPPSGRLKKSALAIARCITGQKRRQDSTSFSEAPRFFIQSLGGIGNTLMATPLIAEVKRIYPHAMIDVYTTSAAATLLRHNSNVNAIMEDRSVQSNWGGRFGKIMGSNYLSVIVQLRKARYDIALLAVNSIDIKSGLRPILSKIPTTVIHGYPFRREDDYTFLFSHIVPYLHQHDCVSNLDLLRAITNSPVCNARMELNIPAQYIMRAQGILKDKRIDEKVPIIGICPGCRDWARDKRWPIEKFARLVKEVLSMDRAVQIMAVCGPHETAEANALQKAVVDERFAVVNDIDILDFAAVLQRCAAVVTNDSLPMHLCSSLSVPVVALFGPTDPIRVGPWLCPSSVLSSTAEYAPYFNMPYFSDLGVGDNCIDTIEVEHVLSAVMKLREDHAALTEREVGI